MRLKPAGMTALLQRPIEKSSGNEGAPLSANLFDLIAESAPEPGRLFLVDIAQGVIHQRRIQHRARHILDVGERADGRASIKDPHLVLTRHQRRHQVLSYEASTASDEYSGARFSKFVFHCNAHLSRTSKSHGHPQDYKSSVALPFEIPERNLQLATQEFQMGGTGHERGSGPT